MEAENEHCARTGARYHSVTDPKWQFGATVGHIYDENKHRTRTGAPYNSVTDPKRQFGAGVAHNYDENEHRAHTGAPYHSVTDPKWQFGAGGAHIYENEHCTTLRRIPSTASAPINTTRTPKAKACLGITSTSIITNILMEHAKPLRVCRSSSNNIEFE
jgi:phage baseplate assembly protein gpV